MSAMEYVVSVLGGPRVFHGRSLPSSVEVRERINEGLPFSAVESIRERLGLSVGEAAHVLQMPARTWARRRQSRRLAATESDRLYRLARIAAHAHAVLGSDDRASAWLRRPNRALGGEAPVTLLDTDVGARQVEDLLGRIEYGIVS